MSTEKPVNRFRTGLTASIVGVGANLALFAAKLAIGLLTGSLAITADGFNNLSDAAASLVTLFGFILGRRPADREHPFGHGRYEYIAALIVAMLILLIGVELFKSALDKILHPAPVTFQTLAALVMAAAIGVKLFLYGFYTRLGKRIQSDALLASGKDARNDCLVTAGALFSLIFSRFSNWPLDGWLSLVIALFVLYSGVQFFKDTLNPLLGVRPGRKVVERITALLNACPEITGLHDLEVHSYGPGRQFASVHAEVSASSDILALHEAIDCAEAAVLSELGIVLTVHMDPVTVRNEEENRFYALALAALRQLDPRLTLHDFRIAQHKQHILLMFDVTLPEGFACPEEDLTRLVTESLARENPVLRAVIHVDYM